MNRKIIFGIIVAIILIILGIVTYRTYFSADKNAGKEIIVAQLVNVSGGNYVESAGYYEGTLVFRDSKTNQEYSVSPCTKDWTWVENGACYNLDMDEINSNVESHKYSMMLNGCYVGSLEKVAC